jgi:hypothetical protein
MSAAPATFTPAYPAVGYGAAPVAFGGYPMTYGAAPIAYGAVASAAPVERQVFQEQVTVPQQYTTFQTQSYMVNVPQVTCSTTTHTRTRQKLCCQRERQGKLENTLVQALRRGLCELVWTTARRHAPKLTFFCLYADPDDRQANRGSRPADCECAED